MRQPAGCGNQPCHSGLESPHIIFSGQLSHTPRELQFEQRGEDLGRSQLRLQLLDQLVKLRRLIVPQSFKDDFFVFWKRRIVK
jgi:hypothetical protein